MARNSKSAFCASSGAEMSEVEKSRWSRNCSCILWSSPPRNAATLSVPTPSASHLKLDLDLAYLLRNYVLDFRISRIVDISCLFVVNYAPLMVSLFPRPIASTVLH